MKTKTVDSGNPAEATDAGKRLQEELTVRFPNLWELADDQTRRAADTFAVDYRRFLDQGKTEREFITVAVEALEASGFRPLTEQDKLQAGDKIYRTIHGKALAAAVIGEQPATEGCSIVGAHVDSPRLDLKPMPLYEDNDLVFLKTHYYGGIKKYQWPGQALALHGVVIRKDGTPLTVVIGEDDDDPVLTITDLLPHLGAEQMGRSAPEIIRGEELNVLCGGIPYPDKKLPGRFKLGILQLLRDQYGLDERDLVTAELEIVPAGKARDVGLDRSMIGAYGQDDRVCAYTGLAALTSLERPRRTAICMLFDKEEIGSEGNTGAQSRAFELIMREIFIDSGGRDGIDFDRFLNRSALLSGDVAAAFDPTFPSVYDTRNSTWLGRGMAFVKYVGSRGKSGSSDASAEFFASVTRLLDARKIPWQTGELGKVDAGGGGTIAKYLANLGIEVIDCGVPVLSMHSPFEVTGKLDVYYTYLAYQAFLEEA